MWFAYGMAERNAYGPRMQSAYAVRVKISSPRHLRRRDNLQRLVDDFESIADLARAAETPRPHLSACLAGAKGIGDALAAKLEIAGAKAAGWMDEDHQPQTVLKVEEEGSPYMAHGLSHQPEQTPTLSREELMSVLEVKGEFWVELWDEAIGQELPKGTLTLWDAGLVPEVGDFVLIRTADGRPHVRVYGESLAHGWQGKPLHSDYEAIPGAGAKVLAVFVSAKVRRSQLRR